MKDLFEWLGITPGQNGWDEDKCEMLEAMIINAKYLYSWSENAMESGVFFNESLYKKNVKTIEKATGRKWKDISHYLKENH